MYNDVIENQKKIVEGKENNTYLLTRIQRLEKIIERYKTTNKIFQDKTFALKHNASIETPLYNVKKSEGWKSDIYKKIEEEEAKSSNNNNLSDKADKEQKKQTKNEIKEEINELFDSITNKRQEYKDTIAQLEKKENDIKKIQNSINKKELLIQKAKLRKKYIAEKLPDDYKELLSYPDWVIKYPTDSPLVLSIQQEKECELYMELLEDHIKLSENLKDDIELSQSQNSTNSRHSKKESNSNSIINNLQERLKEERNKLKIAEEERDKQKEIYDKINNLEKNTKIDELKKIQFLIALIEKNDYYTSPQSICPSSRSSTHLIDNNNSYFSYEADGEKKEISLDIFNDDKPKFQVGELSDTARNRLLNETKNDDDMSYEYKNNESENKYSENDNNEEENNDNEEEENNEEKENNEEEENEEENNNEEEDDNDEEENENDNDEEEEDDNDDEEESEDDI